IGLNTAAIHALWTLKGLGALDGQKSPATAAVIGALAHASAGVRRNAVAVLPPTSETARAILDAGLLDDADAQVRLAALLALAAAPADPSIGEAIATMLARPENIFDKWLPDAATAAAAKHDLAFLEAVTTRFGEGTDSVGSALSRRAGIPPRADESSTVTPRNATEGVPYRAEEGTRRYFAVVAIVSEHYARGGPTDSVGSLLEKIAGADPQLAQTIIAGLAKGWPSGRKVELSGAAEEVLAKLLPRLSTGSRGQLVKLATSWGSEKLQKYADEITESLTSVVADDKRSDDERVAAARQLVEFRGNQSAVIEPLIDLVASPRTSPDVSAGVIEALAGSDSDDVPKALVDKFSALAPAAKKAAVRVLLGRPSCTRVFLDALQSGALHLGDLSLDQKQALAAHPDRAIARRAKEILSRDAGLPNADRQKVLEELLPLAKKSGDAAAGKEVFKQQCAKCHMHSGEGNKIGPDLTGMAVHPKAELLTHLIDPSRNVEGNFRVYTVVTDDGRILTGLLAGETKTAIEIIDAEAKRHPVLRENIEELVASTKSLMPEGFEKQVPAESIVNLLEFLTQRGKYLPLDLRKVATIVSTQGMFYSKEAGAERLIFPDWSPKTFEGVPFTLIDPQGDRVPNVVMLYGPTGRFPPAMPKSVSLPYNGPAKAVHFLSGVSGWGAQGELKDGSLSMIVRLHYADGQTEDHPLRNGEHFADYIGQFDVPKSKLAFKLRSQQVRYFAVQPARQDAIERIELVKGPDHTAPIVMAVTVESL
ncbi:MAG: c-type cytochrome, partial [Pirellulales bacterium]